MAKGFGNMMKQAQKLQQQMMHMQEEMAKKTVEGSAGGGMVTVTMNGDNEVLDIKIDPEVVDQEDVELLEDLVVAAVNNAQENVKTMMSEGMGKILPGGPGGFDIPGLG